MAKHIRIGISRTQVTDLYVEVPDDFDPSNPGDLDGVDIDNAVVDTVDDSDWDFSDPEYRVIGADEVEGEEAQKYAIYEHQPGA